MCLLDVLFIYLFFCYERKMVILKQKVHWLETVVPHRAALHRPAACRTVRDHGNRQAPIKNSCHYSCLSQIIN